MPAYHCGAEIEALSRLGLQCLFYDVGDSFEPDAEELERLTGPRTRALYLIHYFGFPQNLEVWTHWARDRSLLLVEDVAHGWLSQDGERPLGASGDLSIFCFHKSVGTPDGAAALVTRKPADFGAVRSTTGVTGTVRNHAKWIGSRMPLKPRPPRALGPRPEVFPAPEWEPDLAMSASTAFLLPRLGNASIADRRRSNYQALLGLLGATAPERFAELTDGVVPYAFPVLSDRKADLDRALVANAVYARDWPAAHPLMRAAEFPGAASLRARLLMLPTHQELRRRDLEQIADAALSTPAAGARSARR